MGYNEEQLFTGQVSSLHCLFSRNSQATVYLHQECQYGSRSSEARVKKIPTVSYKYVAMETTTLTLTAIMCDLKNPQT